MKDHRRWIIPVAIASVTAVVLAWVFARSHREAGEEAEEERISSPAPILSRTRGGEVVIRLSEAEQAKVGLETQTLKASARPLEMTAYGVVLNPAPLIALNGQLASARAALKASQAEFERARLLHSQEKNVSLKDLQAAESKFRGDQARFDQLGQQLADEWGADIGAMTPDKRARLLSSLVQRTGAMVRVSLAPGQSLPAKPGEARVVVLGYENRPLVTHGVSFAPSVDPNLPGVGFLLRVEAQKFPLRPGAPVTAYLQSPGQPRQGVIVPRSAVVRFDGKAWAYVATGEQDFTRREVYLTEPFKDGWFVTSGLAPGVRVVVAGAQTLLSDELGSSKRPPD